MFSFLYSKSSHKLFCIFIRHYLVCVLSRFPCGDCRGQYPIHRHTHLRIDTHTHTAWTPINLSCCVSFWSSVASRWVCVHVPHACTYMPVCALYVEAGVIWGDLYSVHSHEERERVRWKELGTWGWTVFWHSSTVRKESWKKNNRKETVCLYYALKRSLFSFINLLLAGNLPL